ncbi:MAG: SDR family oxidoreductase [Desulfobacteraceae bacterium]|nr:SDR family oxidoreductase [Desulfobacteraceae bacterium]
MGDEDRRQKTEVRSQGSEDGGRRTEVGCQKTEVGGRRTEVGGQRSTDPPAIARHERAGYAEEKPRETGGRKKIINYSGGGAAGPFPRFSAYATSKAAIVRFTENLALELADEGFDVNSIAPGFVITRLHQDTLEAGPELATEAFHENTKKQMESGGVPPEKAADLTAFLLSDASDGITGKFLSAPWDAWQEEAFQERLRTDKDFATLRRIDDKTFFKFK